MTTYRCIAMDPPWNESGGGKIRRGAQRHYPLLKNNDEIERVVRGSGSFNPADDSHLWMWTTANFLEQAHELGRRLGFRPVTGAVWVKTEPAIEVEVDPRDPAIVAYEPCRKMGLGQYLRIEHEHLLLMVRGRGQADAVWNGHRDVRSTIYAPRGAHSEKPAEAYERIERVSRGPRIEFFARAPREGWDVWGNEV